MRSSEKRNFKTPDNEMEMHDNDDKLLSELGLDREEINELKNPDASGSTALISYINRDGRNLAVKKGVNVDSDLNARREYAFLKLLNRRGGEKTAPDPYFYSSEPESDLLIMEKIEGQNISEISDEDLVKVARKMAQVHKPEFKKPGIPFHKRTEASQYDRLAEQIDFLHGWFDQLAPHVTDVGEGLDLDRLAEAKDYILEEAAEAEGEFLESSFSLIHYDLNPGNIIKDEEGKILFLDWRQASIGDRAMDIAKFFYKNYLDRRQQELFFEIYLAEINDASLRERVEIYTPLIRLGSLLWRLRFLNIDLKEHPEIANEENIKTVRRRLIDDYNYLIAQIETNN